MNLVKSSDSVLTSVGNNWKKSFAFLFLLSLVFFVGLGHVHLFDWDEINFAESAREMMASGDYLRVQINYSPFWEKPPFFFWLQVASMQLFGINEFAARFPNAVFGFIYLITFYLIGKHHFSGRFGLIWALLFVASLLPHIYFKSGIIDPVFNFFIFLSIYFMIRVLNGGQQEKYKSLFAILSGVASGLSVITKGPVGFLLLGLTLIVYLTYRKFKNFPSIKSILLFICGLVIIVGAWLSMEVAQNGFAVLTKFIAYQAELFNSPVAGHAQPFYYHFVVVFIGCFPISILALNQFWQKNPSETPYDLRVWMLSLFWVVLILFSLSTTKIIHYSSMTYIPLSFLAGLSVYTLIESGNSIHKVIRILFLVVGILVALILIALPIIIINKEVLYPMMNDPFAVASLKNSVPWTGIEVIGGIVFLILLLLSFRLLIKRKWDNFILVMAGNMAITLLFVLYFILPKIEVITQGPAIEFLEIKSYESCYIECYGFKSYAQYYYGEVKYSANEDRKMIDWLMNGKIDKPVYLICKITNSELDAHPNFKLIEIKGGFKFYCRKNQ